MTYPIVYLPKGTIGGGIFDLQSEPHDMSKRKKSSARKEGEFGWRPVSRDIALA